MSMSLDHAHASDKFCSSLVRMCTDSDLKEGLRNHLTGCYEKEVEGSEPQMVSKTKTKGSLISLSCSKAAACENGTCFDDNAMKPLRLFAEEDRRKSAPAFPTQKGERYACSKDTSSEFSESIIRFLSDEDSIASFSTNDLPKTKDEEEEEEGYSVAGSTNMMFDSEGGCGATKVESHENMLLHYRHCKRVGQWQGKVEVALRRSIALDTSISPSAKSPRLLRGAPTTVTPRSRKMHVRPANKLDAPATGHHLRSTNYPPRKSLSQSYADTMRSEKYKKATQEREHLHHQIQSQMEETQALRVKLKQLQSSLHNAEKEKAELVRKMRDQNTQQELDIKSKEACILKLESEAEANKKQQADRPQTQAASFIAESNATTCAVALMSKIDSLVHEKEELRSVLAQLWSRVQVTSLTQN